MSTPKALFIGGLAIFWPFIVGAIGFRYCASGPAPLVSGPAPVRARTVVPSPKLAGATVESSQSGVKLLNLDRLAQLLDPRVDLGRGVVETKTIEYDRLAVTGSSSGAQCSALRKLVSARECDLSDADLQPEAFGRVALLCQQRTALGNVNGVYEITGGPLIGNFLSFYRYPDGAIEAQLFNAEYALRGIVSGVSGCLAKLGRRAPAPWE